MEKMSEILTSEEHEEDLINQTKKNSSKIKKKLKKTKAYKIYASMRKIKRVVNEPSFFTEYKRKNKLKRYIDNYKWLFRFRRYNPSYNLFGLDVENFRNLDDYVDIKYIKKDRLKPHHEDDPLAKHRHENITIRYSLLADNKHVFYSYLNSINEELVPKNHLVIQGKDLVAPLDLTNKTTSIDAINKLPNGKYICKATIGAFGDGIFKIEKKNKEIYINNEKSSIEKLIQLTEQEPYIIQEFIKQHPAINKINPSTVNTLRIISTRWNKDTNILAAMIRIGTKGKIVDNASNGGTFVGINIDKGTLMEYGYYYDKPKEKVHPDTKLVYKDYEIPYWQESIELIKKLHPIIFGFATIGWDVAITEDGPVIVEINWNYSVKGIQIASGGFRKRWEELKEK